MVNLDYDPDIDYAPEVEPAEKPKIDPVIYQHYVDLRRSKQHYQFALVGGILGAALGVTVWVGITIMASVQAEWTAVGVACWGSSSRRSAASRACSWPGATS
jgi:hypothetical protein